MGAMSTRWSGRGGRIDKRPEGKEGASWMAHKPLEDIEVAGAERREERGDVRGRAGPGLVGCARS